MFSSSSMAEHDMWYYPGLICHLIHQLTPLVNVVRKHMHMRDPIVMAQPEHCVPVAVLLYGEEDSSKER